MGVHGRTLILFWFGLCLTFVAPRGIEPVTDISEANEWLKLYDKEVSEKVYDYMLAAWNYQTNLTGYNRNVMTKKSLAYSDFVKQASKNASRFDWKNFQDETVRRHFQQLTSIGINALPDKSKLEKLNNVLAKMKEIYSKAKVCGVTDGTCLDMEFGLAPLITKSRDYDLLLKIWEGWRDASGKKMKELYTEFVQIGNEGIQSTGEFDDIGQWWRSWWESDTFEMDLAQMMEQLKPLYKELHTFVRAKLQNVYKDHPFPETGHIPAHLLGNMWAQDWKAISDIVQPYRNKTSINLTKVLKEQNYTVQQIYRTAEDFFISLGLPKLSDSFWKNSLLSKPTDDRDVVCHASAWDLGNKKDYRIKMCTDINLYDLITVHHELGHIIYFMLYKDQPYEFRGGANPGFHEAIGDLITMSVITPGHLKKLGLLKKVENDYESDINFLMDMALSGIAFLPFGYLVDQWRWNVFRGETPPEHYNEDWWAFRCKYQGIYPPVERSPDDFDPGAKYHIPSNTPYIRYFVSHIIQYQFHKSLCDAAGYTGDLHKCDIYNSKAAGGKLRSALQLGSSKPWPDAMEALTGQRNIDIGPMLEYFDPLIQWLKQQNKGQRSGWTEACPRIPQQIKSNKRVEKISDEEEAKKFVDRFDKEAEVVYYNESVTSWKYNTNLTEYNQELTVNSSLMVSEFQKEMQREANKFDWKNFEDSNLKRLFQKITDIGTSALEDKEKLAKLSNTLGDLESIYSTANVCLSNGDCMQIEPGLTEIMTTSRNYSLLTEAWERWRDETGKKMKDKYAQMVDLSNEAIEAAGYHDVGEYWRSAYETTTFQSDLEELLKNLAPLYENLHAYVRRKLKEMYGEKHFPSTGHIPAHLLGNMWAQQWNNVFDLVQPFPNKTGTDVTPKLKELNYNATTMFKTAEKFFISLGLKKMPETFWRNSMITKPNDRDVVCHASAWDFYNKKDFRIKMCTAINMEDLITIHHEMGHIQYYLQYKDQPMPYREGANPGFHEAVGDVMALSVSTPEHLKTIGLLDKVDNDTDSDLNFLMSMALEKIAFLPFGYLIDQWRWSVFDGETTPDTYNEKWWDLRCKYQGVSPPVKRTSADFDPGAKYHIPADVPYIRYFVSFVIQFQFQKALCDEAGWSGPLHRCDIYQNKKAGKKLSDMLKLGSSVPWQDAMEKITGQRKMSASALMDYFSPLVEWLKKQNEGKEIGWEEECYKGNRNLTQAKQWLEEYDNAAQVALYTEIEEEWAYASNITDENQKKQIQARTELSNFKKMAARNASSFYWQSFEDSKVRRLFRKIADIGTDALPDVDKLEKMNTLQSEIEGIYGKGEVCLPPDRCLKLEPDLLHVVATSRNHSELLEAWEGWRDSTGKLMKEKYADFVKLSNEGVRELGYKDTGDYWRSWYESPTFEEDLRKLLDQLKPLYEQLHAYVRGKLHDIYGAENFPDSGHIPAHLLGNMWAQEWNNVYDLVIPYPNKASVDVTPQLREQNYTALKMFETAESFFKSLDLSPMPERFWNKSIIEKPEGREMVCHASAWDFYNQKDFRIKMCTDITMEHLVTIHHEMGHIQYYLQYKDQPVPFREGANPGFHEAIGDTMALSATTPKHLHEIGLLKATDSDYEADINFLMKMALEKIAFLPFGYLIDQWRWSVFKGETTPDKYNDKWWDLRCKYQGISPPVPRSSDDFDPGAKYHIPANTPYIRYFVSFVIQFQFQEALCRAANHTGLLYKCDIYKSKEAGKLLGDVLKLGSSKAWPFVMSTMTGQPNMSAEAIMNYFKPLTDWLKDHNEGKATGWNDTCLLPRKVIEQQARDWLEEYTKMAEKAMYVEYEAEWMYGSNITDYNKNKVVEARLKLSDFKKKAAKNASSFDLDTIHDHLLKRQLRKIADIGTDALNDVKKLEKLNVLQSDIEGIYGKGEVCLSPPQGRCLKLEPDLLRVVATSRNYSELLTAWKGWRENTGRKMKNQYAEFVRLSNEGVRELGYADTGDYWRSWYESSTFEEDLRKLLDQLKPLYEQLHAYVRGKLEEVYGKENFPESGHIPAHLLGNMWAQEWNNIYNIVVPFRNKTSVDVTPTLQRMNYTAMKMFRTAEGFFKSLNLSEMPPEFWNKSIIVKPKGREMVCHASAWDFYNHKDFRIKMCTDITMESLVTIHHEMGHIQYFLQYKDKPVPFRDGANPGFHEAIGDTMALSAGTPKHLHKINLLNSSDSDPDSEINFLMKMALEKIAFLPFGYLIDQWRWSVFKGETPPEKYNDKWWDLRCKYQGVSPPVQRSPDDFDPGAKYHIPANTPYIRYFVSFVIQFQFHKALCEAAGDTGPLHKCDIYNSTAAGKRLGDVLKLGSSEPWPNAMAAITGQQKMSAEPLMEYFKPLTDWLKEQNKNKKTGWDDKCMLPWKAMNTKIQEALNWLEEYNTMAEQAYYEEGEVEWMYATNITDYNEQKVVEARLRLADFDKEAQRNASLLNLKDMFKNDSIKRQFDMLSDIGTSAIKNKTKLEKLNSLQAEIVGIYSKGVVCLDESNSSCVPLEPDLTRMMSLSRDFDLLKKIWKGWRDATGKKMKDKYAHFVELSNEGIEDLGLGYNDTGEYWKSSYESKTFEQDLRDLLEHLKPLYQQLHTYIRKRLRQLYGIEKFPVSGHIPAHILGNMWAQEWQSLYDLVVPFKGKKSVDVTPVLKARNYTAERMFRTANDFFKSLGLKEMPQPFWEKSMMVKPEGREVVCHASAWDFNNRKDFRIKMCTDITMDDLVTIHHEMGHIEYYLQYMDQPVVFRGGANPGFHEAIGDTMALSAVTPKHLNKIGLLESADSDAEADINFLMKMALEKIAFLPFGYLIDQWRWSVFKGETTPDKYNDKWWDLRCKYQGVSPPVERSADDFDPGAKFHIPDNTPYIRYFVSFVIQFQFHRALCQAAGQTGLLYKCDIYNSKEAGKKLSDMLKMGSSKPWPDAMEALTGQRKMDVGPILDYFKPLSDWLEKENEGEDGGWTEDCGTGRTFGDDIHNWLEQYDQRAAIETNKNVITQWNYASNITKETRQKQTEAQLAYAKFQKEAAHNASLLDWQDVKNMKTRRHLTKISKIGYSALSNVEDLKKITNTKSDMETLYSTAVVMMGGKSLSLEPDLTRIMATSTNYDELLGAWKGFRDQTGPKIKPLYTEFVRLSNKAVKELGYEDTGAYWRSDYEDPTFEQDLEDLLEQLNPLYENLHTYVRRELRKRYGADKFPTSGHIPAHLLGNMWAQKWDNVYNLVVPYKNKENIDVSDEMRRQNYTVDRMFHAAEEFFTSLGLYKMTDEFWERTIKKKPSDRDMVCHASAWDFFDRKDFRIKMCTVVNMENLIVIHHEMGHIQYFMQYKDQPVKFREGANPGFHEAVGDVMSLSVQTPAHLRKIGLLKTQEDDDESDLNFLMKMALEKISFLPFGYLIDQWRWSVFRREALPDQFNSKWWELRCKFQGVSPPVERSENDFDPGAKYHIPANYPYIRYFISYVIQFHFHKVLCDAAGHQGPLHKCDIYQSKDAGKLLSDMLKLGSSEPWPVVMEKFTGQRKMDARPIIEYFKPLINWLKKENFNERPGWSAACPSLKSAFVTPKSAEKCTTANAAYKLAWRYDIIAFSISAFFLSRKIHIILFNDH